MIGGGQYYLWLLSPIDKKIMRYFYISGSTRTLMIMISAAHDERDEVVSGDNSGKRVIHVNRDKVDIPRF